LHYLLPRLKSDAKASLPRRVSSMSQLDNSNPVSEHNLYLTLFASNAGGV
jgi:hypothetical protein